MDWANEDATRQRFPSPSASPHVNRPQHQGALSISTLQAILITLALVGYPLVATLSTALSLNGSALAIAMRAAMLTLSILLIAPAISRLKRHHLKYLAVFATFWVAYLMRMVADTTADVSQLSKAASEYWIWAVGVCLIPSLGLMGVAPERALPKAFTLTWLALGLSAALAIFFGSTVVTRLDGTQTDTGRLALEALNPISAGHLGASLVIFSGWYRWAVAKPKRSLKAISVVGMLAGLYLLISSASRGPLIALACVVAAVLLTLKLRKFVKITALGSLVVAALLPAVFSFIDLESLQLAARIAGSTSGEDQSVASRQDSFVGAWNQFLSNPLLGDFLDERSTGFYSHNLILEAFMATGLTGGLAFLALSVLGAWKAYRLIRLRSPHAWAALIYVQYLVAAQLSGAIYSSSIFWSFSVLMLFALAFDHVPSRAKIPIPIPSS